MTQPSSDNIHDCIKKAETVSRADDNTPRFARAELQTLLDALKESEALNKVRTRIIAQQEAAMVKQDAQIAELEGEVKDLRQETRTLYNDNKPPRGFSKLEWEEHKRNLR